MDVVDDAPLDCRICDERMHRRAIGGDEAGGDHRRAAPVRQAVEQDEGYEFEYVLLAALDWTVLPSLWPTWIG